ncbi:MAG TPA: hypothetical protein VGB64_10910 [Actinomycetota bacterium]
MSGIDIACPACGEQDRIRGARDGEAITITCERCDTAWTRDPRPTCPSCGGTDLIETPKAVAEKVRGDQMSIVGYTSVYLCRVCDATTIDELAKSKAALPPDDLPVKSRHGWGAQNKIFPRND